MGKMSRKQTQNKKRTQQSQMRKEARELHISNLINRVGFAAYRTAVKEFFGCDLPDDLLARVTVAIDAGFKQSVETEQDVDIGGPVIAVVKAYMAEHSMTGPVIIGTPGIEPSSEAAADAIDDLADIVMQADRDFAAAFAEEAEEARFQAHSEYLDMIDGEE